MEHFLVHSLISSIKWIDRCCQKSLKRAIPDVDQLLRDPAGTLGVQDVLIGPWRRYGTAGALALLVTFLGWLVFALVESSVDRNLGVPHHQQGDRQILLIILLLPMPLASFALLLFFFRGGCLTLTRAGAELQFRGKTVFCPWAIFNATGHPFSPSMTKLHLPINPAGIPQVELRREGSPVAQGKDVDAPQWQFQGNHSVILKAVYEVDAMKLGVFLLDLGRQLDKSSPSMPAVVVDETTPIVLPVRLEKNGWIRISLTHWNLPPFCCICDMPTQQYQNFDAAPTVFKLGSFLRFDGNDRIKVPIPYCDSCRTASRRHYNRIVTTVVGLAVGVPLILGVMAALLTGDPRGLFCGLLLFIGAIGCLVVSGSFTKRRARPVELERYSPRKGTVAIRFKHQAYARRVLTALTGR
jgi:hypothetical protein